MCAFSLFDVCFRSSGLGAWLNTQRHVNRIGKLAPDRKIKLQKLVDAGLLYWDQPLTHWEENYQDLLKFGTMHGHYNAPGSQGK